jgi:hypothetical protein
MYLRFINSVASYLRKILTGKCFIKTDEIENRLAEIEKRRQCILFIFVNADTDADFLAITSNKILRFNYSVSNSSNHHIMYLIHENKLEYALKDDILSIFIQRQGNGALLKKFVKLLLFVEDETIIGCQVSKLRSDALHEAL